MLEQIIEESQNNEVKNEEPVIEIIEQDEAPKAEEPVVTEATEEQSNQDEPVEKEEVDFSATDYQEQPHENKVPAKKRIGQLTYKVKSIESERDALRSQLDERNRQIEELNSKVSTFIDSQTQIQNQNQLKELEKSYIEAIEVGDHTKASEINFKYQQEILKTQQTNTQPTAQQQNSVAPQQPQQVPPVLTPTQQSFISRNNEWYGRDNLMMYSLQNHEQAILNDPNWSYRNESDIYQEIERRVQKDFPHRFKNTSPSVSPTEGVSNNATVPSKNKITVKRSEINQLKMFSRFSEMSDNEVAKIIYERKVKGE